MITLLTIQTWLGEGRKQLRKQHEIRYKQKLKFLGIIVPDIAQLFTDVKSDMISVELYTMWLYLMFQVTRLAFFGSYQNVGEKLLSKGKSQTLDRVQKVFGLFS